MQFATYLLLLSVSVAYSLDYSDLETLGVACPQRDSCRDMPPGTNFTRRSCECDFLCGVFGDCCVDADVRVAPRRRYRVSSSMSCMPFGSEPDRGVYVVEKCPRNYAGPDALRSGCETDDHSDPMVAAPVTETGMGITYKNRYCAECNNASPDALETWRIFLNCETLSTYDLEDDHIWRNLEYRATERSWGLTHEEEFHTCELIFDTPENIRSGIRFCRTNLTYSCPSTYRRTSVVRACGSYMAVLYGVNNTSFRNVHCAICNGHPIGSLYCNQGWISIRGNKPFSFALLLDVNRSDGDIVGESSRCPRKQKWDPFFKKCRELVCALPGFKMVNGKCKKSKSSS